MKTSNDQLLSRRDTLGSLTLGSAALFVACAVPKASVLPAVPPTNSGGDNMSSTTALAGSHSVVPLPFAAGALSGISERLIVSHHDNNYASAVKNLNRVEQDLAQLSGETPPYAVAALREKELAFRNSKTLHEAYFANLGGDGKRSGAIETAIGLAYGSSARWEQHMRATALGLGGGSGWAILAFELETGALRTVSSGNHTQTLANSVPLLVLDMYEHSYQMDFGAAAARYVDAFFVNANWDEVNRRLERAHRLSSLFRAVSG